MSKSYFPGRNLPKISQVKKYLNRMDVIHTYLRRFFNCNVVLEPTSKKGFEPRLKVVINSFGNKKFRQPMRMLSMHSRALVFCFLFFGFWGWGGFFSFFSVPNVVSLCSDHVLQGSPPPNAFSKTFPIAPRFYPNFLHEQGDLLLFILITSLITLISAHRACKCCFQNFGHHFSSNTHFQELGYLYVCLIEGTIYTMTLCHLEKPIIKGMTTIYNKK